MIAVIDYKAGNLHSVKNALDYLLIDSVVTDDEKIIRGCDGIILPGVGAFSMSMKALADKGLANILIEEAQMKPFLGICLGMQMLFEKSFEFGETIGLGLIKGTVEKIEDSNVKIPHMGWNSLKFLNDSPLLKGINEGDYVYFVHSFKAVTDNKNINAFCEYEQTIPALVSCGNIYGAQFHPEKSGKVGLQILRNFKELIG